MFTPIQINCIKNVIQAEIPNQQPIRDLHTSVILGIQKKKKKPQQISTIFIAQQHEWIVELNQAASHSLSANESRSEGLSANHSCYLPPSPICKPQAVIVMSSTSKTLQYVMSTHLTHTETLYKSFLTHCRTKRLRNKKIKKAMTNQLQICLLLCNAVI